MMDEYLLDLLLNPGRLKGHTIEKAHNDDGGSISTIVMDYQFLQYCLIVVIGGIAGFMLVRSMADKINDEIEFLWNNARGVFGFVLRYAGQVRRLVSCVYGADWILLPNTIRRPTNDDTTASLCGENMDNESHYLTPRFCSIQETPNYNITTDTLQFESKKCSEPVRDEFQYVGKRKRKPPPIPIDYKIKDSEFANTNDALTEVPTLVRPQTTPKLEIYRKKQRMAGGGDFKMQRRIPPHDIQQELNKETKSSVHIDEFGDLLCLEANVIENPVKRRKDSKITKARQPAAQSPREKPTKGKYRQMEQSIKAQCGPRAASSHLYISTGKFKVEVTASQSPKEKLQVLPKEYIEESNTEENHIQSSHKRLSKLRKYHRRIKYMEEKKLSNSNMTDRQEVSAIGETVNLCEEPVPKKRRQPSKATYLKESTVDASNLATSVESDNYISKQREHENLPPKSNRKTQQASSPLLDCFLLSPKAIRDYKSNADICSTKLRKTANQEKDTEKDSVDICDPKYFAVQKQNVDPINNKKETFESAIVDKRIHKQRMHYSGKGSQSPVLDSIDEIKYQKVINGTPQVKNTEFETKISETMIEKRKIDDIYNPNYFAGAKKNSENKCLLEESLGPNNSFPIKKQNDLKHNINRKFSAHEGKHIDIAIKNPILNSREENSKRSAVLTRSNKRYNPNVTESLGQVNVLEDSWPKLSVSRRPPKSIQPNLDQKEITTRYAIPDKKDPLLPIRHIHAVKHDQSLIHANNQPVLQSTRISEQFAEPRIMTAQGPFQYPPEPAERVTSNTLPYLKDDPQPSPINYSVGSCLNDTSKKRSLLDKGGIGTNGFQTMLSVQTNEQRSLLDKGGIGTNGFQTMLSTQTNEQNTAQNFPFKMKGENYFMNLESPLRSNIQHPISNTESLVKVNRRDKGNKRTNGTPQSSVPSSSDAQKMNDDLVEERIQHLRDTDFKKMDQWQKYRYTMNDAKDTDVSTVQNNRRYIDKNASKKCEKQETKDFKRKSSLDVQGGNKQNHTNVNFSPKSTDKNQYFNTPVDSHQPKTLFKKLNEYKNKYAGKSYKYHPSSSKVSVQNDELHQNLDWLSRKNKFEKNIVSRWSSLQSSEPSAADVHKLNNDIIEDRIRKSKRTDSCHQRQKYSRQKSTLSTTPKEQNQPSPDICSNAIDHKTNGTYVQSMLKTSSTYLDRMEENKSEVKSCKPSQPPNKPKYEITRRNPLYEDNKTNILTSIKSGRKIEASVKQHTSLIKNNANIDKKNNGVSNDLKPQVKREHSMTVNGSDSKLSNRLSKIKKLRYKFHKATVIQTQEKDTKELSVSDNLNMDPWSFDSIGRREIQPALLDLGERKEIPPVNTSSFLVFEKRNKVNWATSVSTKPIQKHPKCKMRHPRYKLKKAAHTAESKEQVVLEASGEKQNESVPISKTVNKTKETQQQFEKAIANSYNKLHTNKVLPKVASPKNKNLITEADKKIHKFQEITDMHCKFDESSQHLDKEKHNLKPGGLNDNATRQKMHYGSLHQTLQINKSVAKTNTEKIRTGNQNRTNSYSLRDSKGRIVSSNTKEHSETWLGVSKQITRPNKSNHSTDPPTNNSSKMDWKTNKSSKGQSYLQVFKENCRLQNLSRSPKGTNQAMDKSSELNNLPKKQKSEEVDVVSHECKADNTLIDDTDQPTNVENVLWTEQENSIDVANTETQQNDLFNLKPQDSESGQVQRRQGTSSERPKILYQNKKQFRKQRGIKKILSNLAVIEALNPEEEEELFLPQHLPDLIMTSSGNSSGEAGNMQSDVSNGGHLGTPLAAKREGNNYARAHQNDNIELNTDRDAAIKNYFMNYGLPKECNKEKLNLKSRDNKKDCNLFPEDTKIMASLTEDDSISDIRSSDFRLCSPKSNSPGIKQFNPTPVPTACATSTYSDSLRKSLPKKSPVPTFPTPNFHDIFKDGRTLQTWTKANIPSREPSPLKNINSVEASFSPEMSQPKVNENNTVKGIKNKTRARDSLKKCASNKGNGGEHEIPVDIRDACGNGFFKISPDDKSDDKKREKRPNSRYFNENNLHGGKPKNQSPDVDKSFNFKTRNTDTPELKSAREISKSDKLNQSSISDIVISWLADASKEDFVEKKGKSNADLPNMEIYGERKSLKDELLYPTENRLSYEGCANSSPKITRDHNELQWSPRRKREIESRKQSSPSDPQDHNVFLKMERIHRPQIKETMTMERQQGHCSNDKQSQENKMLTPPKGSRYVKSAMSYNKKKNVFCTNNNIANPDTFSIGTSEDESAPHDHPSLMDMTMIPRTEQPRSLQSPLIATDTIHLAKKMTKNNNQPRISFTSPYTTRIDVIQNDTKSTVMQTYKLNSDLGLFARHFMGGEQESWDNTSNDVSTGELSSGSSSWGVSGENGTISMATAADEGDDGEGANESNSSHQSSAADDPRSKSGFGLDWYRPSLQRQLNSSGLGTETTVENDDNYEDFNDTDNSIDRYYTLHTSDEYMTDTDDYSSTSRSSTETSCRDNSNSVEQINSDISHTEQYSCVAAGDDVGGGDYFTFQSSSHDGSSSSVSQRSLNNMYSYSHYTEPSFRSNFTRCNSHRDLNQTLSNNNKRAMTPLEMYNDTEMSILSTHGSTSSNQCPSDVSDGHCQCHDSHRLEKNDATFYNSASVESQVFDQTFNRKGVCEIGNIGIDGGVISETTSHEDNASTKCNPSDSPHQSQSSRTAPCVTIVEANNDSSTSKWALKMSETDKHSSDNIFIDYYHQNNIFKMEDNRINSPEKGKWAQTEWQNNNMGSDKEETFCNCCTTEESSICTCQSSSTTISSSGSSASAFENSYSWSTVNASD